MALSLSASQRIIASSIARRSTPSFSSVIVRRSFSDFEEVEEGKASQPPKKRITSFLKGSILGNVGAVPKVSEKGGIKFVSFPVAVNKLDGVDWHKVIIRASPHSSIETAIVPGLKVLAYGDLDVAAFNDKNNQPRAGATVWASTNDVTFVSYPKNYAEAEEAEKKN